jgi:hypothetical protein
MSGAAVCSSGMGRATAVAPARMHPGAWTVPADWTTDRTGLPLGPLFCVINGPTRARAWSASAVRAELRNLPSRPGAGAGATGGC